VGSTQYQAAARYWQPPPGYVAQCWESDIHPTLRCKDCAVGGFVELFRVASSRVDAVRGEEVVAPVWFGPPEEEFGVVVPQSLLLARSETGVVELRFVTAFSTGLLFDLIAGARGLKESRAQALFHEQHVADPEEGLPEGFLRVGVEYPDGRRASNLTGRHRFWQSETPPEEPVLVQAGGGGGSAASGRVRMNPGYWLWPLPPAGRLRVFVEWPIVGIKLSSIDVASAPLVEAASCSERLWYDRS
jgi:hypothetical protein